MSILNQLVSISSKASKRVGRGEGSGKGSHASSRGQKGQKSRVGSKVPLWFEGGQLPLIKRLPMQRGKGRFVVLKPTARITLSDLEKMGASVVTLETLKLAKLVDKRFKKAKVVATGSLTKSITVRGLRVSAAAKEHIQKAGGIVE